MKACKQENGVQRSEGEAKGIRDYQDWSWTSAPVSYAVFILLIHPHLCGTQWSALAQEHWGGWVFSTLVPCIQGLWAAVPGITDLACDHWVHQLGLFWLKVTENPTQTGETKREFIVPHNWKVRVELPSRMVWSKWNNVFRSLSLLSYLCSVLSACSDRFSLHSSSNPHVLSVKLRSS